MDIYRDVVASTLFPLQEWLKGHNSVAQLKALEQSQWLSPDALVAEQGRRLQHFMQQVGTQIPYYQAYCAAHSLAPSDFTTLAALQRLPVTDKAFMRQHSAQLYAKAHQSSLVAQCTSGSSGEPLQFWLSKHRISNDIALKRRASRWWDVDIGDREIVLWGAAQENAKQQRAWLREWRDRLLRTRLIPAAALYDERLDHILNTLIADRPQQIFGYPSALARLAYHAQQNAVPLGKLGIKAVFCTSEVLKPEWRHAISTTFQCGVANEYGARDAGLIARECPQGGLHISAESIIVEILDAHNQPVMAGEEGDIVITNLSGPEFPFIRYRTGDRGAFSPQCCPCGRGLPCLATVSGRANDGLINTDGEWVHGSAANYIMRTINGLRAYRIQQDHLHQLHLYIDSTPSLSATEQIEIQHKFQHLLGKPLMCTIELRSPIPPLANGKFRHIVCNIPQEKTGSTP